MKTVYLFYNLFILVLFAIAFLSSFYLYRKTKRKICFYIYVLFLFYIFDNLLIYFTEAVSSFSKYFSRNFLTTPALKTVIILTTLYCIMRINRIILDIKDSQLFINLLICVGAALLFIPMLPDSSFKMWIYFTICQLYTLLLGFYALKKMNNSIYLQTESARKFYHFVVIWTIVLSLLIILEDTIVIFYFDSYTDFLIKIRFRNLCEDIMSIGYAVFAIISITQLITVDTSKTDMIMNGSDTKHTQAPESVSSIKETVVDTANEKETVIQEPEAIKETEMLPTPEHIIIDQHDNRSENSLENMIFQEFCNKYDFTNRECTCFELILQGKTNQEISDDLVISLGTVKTHTHNLFRKCDVTNRRELKNTFLEYKKGHYDL